jgi:glutathione S-transferase
MASATFEQMQAQDAHVQHASVTMQAPLEFEAVHVDLSNKPKWYKRVNPRGLVPAVTWGDSTLLESLDICK